MRNRGGWRVLCIAVVLSQAIAQARPRVALVLEGGGALGFAHIGVLEYLEQKHIPVDLVVGTSMGGLVGGLYAIGETPAEIQRLTNDIDWNTVLSGRTTFQDLNYRRKEDRFAFPNAFEFGLKNKRLNLPAGLNQGHQTGLVIDRATLAYPDNLKFDDLPIPFRCVATDITVGREKIFDRGSIAQSLRATMAIPAVFAPVVIDGHAYTDGLAVDNLPVDVAKRAGADIVIAVYLDVGPVNPNQYESLFSVAARNLSIMVSANELRNMEAADILLTAKLAGFTSSSFTDGPEIVPKGYAAAQEKARLLNALSLDETEWQRYLAKRDAKIRRELPIPEFVQVIGNNANYNAELERNLQKYVGRPIDPPVIEATLNKFLGTGVMSSVGYTTARNDQGQPGLEVKTYEKTYAPPLVNLGISLDGSDPDNVLFGVAARVTFMDLGGYRAEWRNDGFFGSTYGVRSEYYKPFSKRSPLFFAPHIYALSSPFTEYSGKDRLALYRIERLGFGADVGYTIGSRSEIRVGEDLFWFRVLRKIVSEPVFNETNREALTSLQYRFYGSDNAQLPTRGLNLAFTAGHYQIFDLYPNFNQAELRAEYFQPVGENSSLIFGVNGGTAFHATVGTLGLQSFALGGPFRLGAYGLNQLLGNQYFLLQSGYEQKLTGFSPFFGNGLYAVGLFEAGKTYGVSNGVPALPLDGTLALVARTAIGPVFVGTSIGNGGNRKWWFGVGRIF